MFRGMITSCWQSSGFSACDSPLCIWVFSYIPAWASTEGHELNAGVGCPPLAHASAASMTLVQG